MKKRFRLILATTLSLMILGLCQTSFGQVRTYYPSRPTLSPYFGYFQVNTTGLPNYQAIVRPQFQLDRGFQQISSGVRREGERINTLERQVRLRTSTDADAGTLVRQRTAGPVAPARAGTFMNYSSFYPNQTPLRRRR